VLRENVDEYFEMRPGEDSPYMLLVAPVRPEKRLPDDPRAAELQGIEKLKLPRSTVPAITHVDYSARVQTVDAARNPLYDKLLRAFERRTGCPVIINTSFNVRGEPIVGSPADAYRCFLATNIDVLALGRCVLRKTEHQAMSRAEVEAHLAQFQLD
jgi:carbamoyltransferase